MTTFAAEFNKTNRYMDIKSVIYKHGYTVNSLAKAKGIGQSRLNQMVNGNPSAKNLEWLASLIGCHPAEFFADWQGDGQQPQAAEPAPAEPEKQTIHQNVIGDVKAGSYAEPPKKNNLPFDNNEQPTQSLGVFVCPHCGAGVSFGAFVVSKPAEKEGEQ